MRALSIVLGVGFLALVVLCSLSTALASAMASAANGVALAAAASAVQTSQCVTGLAVLAAGVVSMGAMVVALRVSAGRGGQLLAPRPRQFLRELPAPRPQMVVLDEAGDVLDDVIFSQKWGWPL